MLLTGVVMLDDIKDPDRKVTIEYWKPCKVDKKEYMSLRDVLNSIKVQGGIDGKDVHVIHGICPAPGGGWEAGVVSSIPLAHTTSTNIAAHPAGWVFGYLKKRRLHQTNSQAVLHSISLCLGRKVFVGSHDGRGQVRSDG